jgi:chitosanase
MRIRRRTLALGTGITVLVCVPLAVSVGAGATSDVLISRDRTAVASSVRGSQWIAGKVTDADPASRWASTDGPGTQWVRVDLGATRKIDRVRLKWDDAFAKTYRVQTSMDGANWKDVYATRSGNGGTDDLKRLGGSGRFVRVLAIQRGRSAGGYSLAEVRAYGPKAAPLRAVAPVSGSLATGLDDGRKKETALKLVSSAENSTLDWRTEYGYIEDLGDGRGYTAGIVGFCSGTSDMLDLINEYTRRKPDNLLARYLPALRTVDGSDSHAGLDPGFTTAWKAAAGDPIFQKAQEDERDWMYFDPAVRMARADGLRALGQFAYFDAAVMHGVSGLRGIRTKALRAAKAPADGGDEIGYLNAFLDARADEMRTEEAHSDTSRVDTAQRSFLQRSNLDLTGPLTWKVYGDGYTVSADQ